jgi:hypothetical protein
MGRLLTVLGLGSMVAITGGCQPLYNVEMTTPTRSALDVSRFERVFVAGFFSHAGDPIDTDTETVRLLRSQLRRKATLPVADNEALAVVPPQLHDADYWRRVGEEHPHALIVTGSVSFASQLETTFVPLKSRPLVSVNAPGRSAEIPTADQQHYTLRVVFLFIDGDTGTTLSVRPFQLESRYDAFQTVPALSAYFDLMDHLLPNFLAIVSDHTFHGTRVLLK